MPRIAIICWLASMPLPTDRPPGMTDRSGFFSPSMAASARFLASRNFTIASAASSASALIVPDISTCVGRPDAEPLPRTTMPSSARATEHMTRTREQATI